MPFISLLKRNHKTFLTVRNSKISTNVIGIIFSVTQRRLLPFVDAVSNNRFGNFIPNLILETVSMKDNNLL